jgi:hypothetical protein
MTFKGFGCVVGDTLYVVSLEKNKVCEFKVDCLKLFTDDITAHGYIYGLYGKWGPIWEPSWRPAACQLGMI